MKTFWDIDIDNKIAELKENDDIKLKIKFDVDIDENGIIINQNEVLEKNFNSNIVADTLPSRIARFMRLLGDEMSLLYFQEKVQFLNETDTDYIKMYLLEDNIYVSEDGEICILRADGFIDTDYYTLIEDVDENTSKNLIKLTIIGDKNQFLTFNEFKNFIL